MPALTGNGAAKCSALPALAGIAARSVAESAGMLEAAPADAARQLDQVRGALQLVGEPGLAALVQLAAELMRDEGGAALSVNFAERLHELEAIIRKSFACRLRGESFPLTDLLGCWRRLASGERQGTLHPSLLLSLQLPAAAPLPLPHAPLQSDFVAEDAERAMLSFLRAEDRGQRTEAARVLAGLAESALVQAPQRDTQAQWLVVRAWLLEQAEHAGASSDRMKKILAAAVRALRHHRRAEGEAALAACAREALFGLAQGEPATDVARDVVQLFDLRRQFDVRAAATGESEVPDDSDRQFRKALGMHLSALEANAGSVADPDRWLALADAAADTTHCRQLAMPLREQASRLTAGAADPRQHALLAAVLLLLNEGGPADDVGPILAALLNDEHDRAATLLYLASPSPLPPLCQTLCEQLQAAEQQLDAALAQGELAHALQEADLLLAGMAGAMALLCAPVDASALASLRDRLACVPPEPAEAGKALQALSSDWVALSESIALLPWQWALPVPAAPRADPGRTALQSVFIGEAGRLLAALRAPDNAASPDTWRHALHTLVGCSSTVGLAAMSALAQALLSALDRDALFRHPQLLGTSLDALERMLAEFIAGAGSEAATALLARWEASASAPPALALQAAERAGDLPPCSPFIPEEPANITESTGSPVPAASTADTADGRGDNVQRELRALFDEEAADLLPQLEQTVREWQQRPDDRELPAQMLRVLHTLKGSARVAGRHGLGESFHHAESEVAALAGLAPAAVAPALPALLARVDQWIAGQPASPPSPPAPQDLSVSASAAVSPPSVDAPSAAAAPRLHAGQLEQFADTTVELWAGNARISEGLQRQRHTIGDLSDDLARLRAQLRELEIEAESRIIARADGTAADFDPLEFDRYTRLHELTRMIAESIADIVDMQRRLARESEGLASSASVQARDLRRLQADLQALRSQPLRTIEARLRHLVRQAAQDARRDASLVVDGAAVQIERGLLDQLLGPLGHLLRNAVVHGIEAPDEREAAGKPRIGTISLSATLTGNTLRLSVQDDGRGLDLARIRERALAIGLLAPDEAHDARRLAALIFEPGFSTASELTALSGRGIGLDAVRAGLQAAGGRIDVDSQPGRGCRFDIQVPVSLAGVQLLLARAGRHRVALGAAQVLQVMQLGPDALSADGSGAHIDWQGRRMRLLRLAAMLGEPSDGAIGPRVPVAVLRDGEQWLAIQLDAVDGQRELLVRHPGPQLAQVPGLSGACLLPDGSIALIIDPFRLPATGLPLPAPVAAEAGALVLIVDDSLTVRRANQRLLERHGYRVALARDGVEALERLRECRPAAVLLDIEMPRMDGFELLTAMRDDVQMRELPVLMMTSRIAERHRERAQRLGANAYLGKPCPEEDLLAALARVMA